MLVFLTCQVSLSASLAGIIKISVYTHKVELFTPLSDFLIKIPQHQWGRSFTAHFHFKKFCSKTSPSMSVAS